MKKRMIWLSAGIASALAIFLWSSGAHAITVPDSGTCSTSATCFKITQNGTGTNQVGISGIATTANAIGVLGQNSSTSANGAGVYGSASTGTGVYGLSSSGAAVIGTSTSSYGVYGTSSANGVFGTSSASQGIFGQSTCGTGGTCVGVYGYSVNGNGVWGNTTSSTNAAVVAIAPNPGIGTYSVGGTAYYGVGNIIITGTASMPGGGPWANSSDIRVKKDIRSFDQGLSELMKIRTIRYKYNGLGGMPDNGKEYAGVIAQDLERVMPDMVFTRTGKLHPSDAKDTPIKMVDGNDYTYLLINAVKEQQKIIERQGERIEALEQGRPPRLSSMTPLGGIETGLTLGLLPVGVVVALRRRRKST